MRVPKSNFLLSLLRVLKLPLKLLVGFFGKKPKRKRSDLEKKQLAYVRNFSPKHYGWQRNLRKKQKTVEKKKLVSREKIRQKLTKN